MATIAVEKKCMTIKKPDGESLTVELHTADKTATVTNGVVKPLTISVTLALQIAMYAMRNNLYTLDELYPLSKLAKRKIVDVQSAHEQTWGVANDE
jgi:hypothetical protein